MRRFHALQAGRHDAVRADAIRAATQRLTRRAEELQRGASWGQRQGEAAAGAAEEEDEDDDDDDDDEEEEEEAFGGDAFADPFEVLMRQRHEIARRHSRGHRCSHGQS